MIFPKGGLVGERFVNATPLGLHRWVLEAVFRQVIEDGNRVNITLDKPVRTVFFSDLFI